MNLGIFNYNKTNRVIIFQFTPMTKYSIYFPVLNFTKLKTINGKTRIVIYFYLFNKVIFMYNKWIT